MLADFVGGVHIEAVSSTQLLDQLTTKLDLLNLFSSSDFKLSQPITSATDHQVVKLHTLPSATEGIESLTNRGSLSDRMTRTASRHPVSVAPGTAPARQATPTRLHSVWFRTTTSNPAKTGSSGRVSNRQARLDALLCLLMEPAGREARRSAAQPRRPGKRSADERISDQERQRFGTGRN